MPAAALFAGAAAKQSSVVIESTDGTSFWEETGFCCFDSPNAEPAESSSEDIAQRTKLHYGRSFERQPAWGRGKRMQSLRRKITVAAVRFWFFPVVLLLAVLGIYLRQSSRSMNVETFQSQVHYDCAIGVERLRHVIRRSDAIKDDGEILMARSKAEKGEYMSEEAGKLYAFYFKELLRREITIKSVIMWFPEDGEDGDISAFTFGNETGDEEQGRKLRRMVSDRSAKPDSSAYRRDFFSADGEFYLLVHLDDATVQDKALVALKINKDFILEIFLTDPYMENMAVWVNGTNLLMGDGDTKPDWGEILAGCGENNYYWLRNELFVSGGMESDGYLLQAAMHVKNSAIRLSYISYIYVMLALILGTFGVMRLMYRAFYREVTEPVEAILEATKAIENGELGRQVEHKPRNMEFSYIIEAIDQMSKNLKLQFDRIYEEEVALREARIKALQSNINPHFLNNTMEIINWEAMLAGNEKVSRMIGALSTMMDAALDRRKNAMVSLAEEMEILDAYLLIMGERFGTQLEVEEEIPGEFLACRVPRLMIQPIVENAIDHGVSRNGKGKVSVSAGRDGSYLRIIIHNDGILTTPDQKKIEKLLSPDYSAAREASGHIGIANVNQRLRILFGDPCGLRIEGEVVGENTGLGVTSILTMPWIESDQEGGAGYGFYTGQNG
ncbi:MAG: sensor histidine kinase [Blautia sp.]|nr:sensor histidine kinase [Blautia sp.]